MGNTAILVKGLTWMAAAIAGKTRERGKMVSRLPRGSCNEQNGKSREWENITNNSALLQSHFPTLSILHSPFPAF